MAQSLWIANFDGMRHQGVKLPVRRLAIFLIVLNEAGCVAASPATVDPGTSIVAAEVSLTQFSTKIQSVLQNSDVNVRINFEGKCSKDAGYFEEVAFPQLKLAFPAGNASDLEKLRSIFSDSDTFVSVSGEDQDFISIQIGRPDLEILQTNINKLEFDNLARYNARFALSVVDSSPEVIMASEKLGLTQTIGTVFGLVYDPEIEKRELPDLPNTIENVSMNTALNMIAVELDSYIFFGSCNGKYMTRSVRKSEQAG
jgi:hypothetical protein